MSDTKNYKVGYRKPPVEHQFQAGQRANPRGRPKGSPNLATVLKRAARQKAAVNEGGKRKTLTMLELAVKQLMAKAAGGDTRAIQLALELVDRVERLDTPAILPVDAATRARTDAEILKALKGRLLGGKSRDHDDDGEQ